MDSVLWVVWYYNTETLPLLERAWLFVIMTALMVDSVVNNLVAKATMMIASRVVPGWRSSNGEWVRLPSAQHTQFRLESFLRFLVPYYTSQQPRTRTRTRHLSSKNNRDCIHHLINWYLQSSICPSHSFSSKTKSLDLKRAWKQAAKTLLL